MERRNRRVRATVGVVAAAIILLVGVPMFFSRGPDARPNIIIISIDSLRPDHLGCYGYHRPTSPTLDRFAAEGALFETAISSTSWTLPSHAALFTGLPDRVHACFDGSLWLDDTRQTIAEVLAGAGYETAGFFAGPWLHPVFGMAQGFETYHNCTSYSERTMSMLKQEESSATLGQLSARDVTNPTVLESVKKWLDGRSDRPFFLFIHLWDVHYDYIPPRKYVEIFDPHYTGKVDGRVDTTSSARPADWSDEDCAHFVARNDGEIRWTDDTLGELFATLRSRGLYDDTVIAVTADHGEAFFEHGVTGHRQSVRDEEIKIPLILRYPKAIPAGGRIRRPAHLTDVAPTLLKLAGAPPFDFTLGRDLSPSLRDPGARWEDEPLLAELLLFSAADPQLCLRTSEWKLIVHLKTSTQEVYDLVRDPGEQHPLAEEDYPVPPATLQSLYEAAIQRMAAAIKRLPTPGARPTVDLPAMTKEQLRRLGYLR